MNIFVWIRLIEWCMNLFVWMDSYIVLWMFIVHSNNQFRLKYSYIIVWTLLEHSMNSQTRKNSFVTVTGSITMPRWSNARPAGWVRWWQTSTMLRDKKCSKRFNCKEWQLCFAHLGLINLHVNLCRAEGTQRSVMSSVGPWLSGRCSLRKHL